MSNKYNTKQQLVSAASKAFVVNNVQRTIRSNFIDANDVSFEKSVGQSLLNTIVLDNLIFEASTYETFDGRTISFNELRIDNALIEVTQRKNIVKTQIVGRDGTIKELVSIGDYDISIRGVLQNYDKSEQSIYPSDLAIELRKICESTRSLHVFSKFLSEIFDVQYIVIENHAMPQTEGTRNVQMFTISAVSDVEHDLPELI